MDPPAVPPLDTPAVRRRRFAFPSPYTVLFAVIALAAAATWVFPAGRYDELTYSAERRAFVVASPEGERVLPPTQRTLDSLRLRARAEDFTAGKFSKPMTVPGTYRRSEPRPQGPLAVLRAPIEGLYEAIDVVLFVLVIGGFIGVFNQTGAFDAGLAALARRLRGREGVLVVLVTALMALGGTTFGMGEETLAFYPLLVPVFLAAGYDRMVPLAVILGGSHVGALASTTNPFATIIASDAAGVSWTTGLGGRIGVLAAGVALLSAYTLRYAHRVKADASRSLVEPGVAPAAAETDPTHAPPLNGRVKGLLALFALTFVVMVVGVSGLGDAIPGLPDGWLSGWWFPEMTALFLGGAIVVGLVQRTGEPEGHDATRGTVESFLAGARDLLGVAFIIGVARGVTVVLTNGGLSGTLLAASTGAIAGMPPVLFVLGLLAFYFALAVVVPSSSGMAVLTMPIMSALGAAVGAPPEEVVNAYLYGIGLMFLVSPSSLVLPSLAMAGVGYDRWLRFIGPLLGLLAALSALALVLGVAF